MTSALTALAFVLLQLMWLQVMDGRVLAVHRSCRVMLPALRVWNVVGEFCNLPGVDSHLTCIRVLTAFAFRHFAAVAALICAPCAIAFTCVCDGITCTSEQGDFMYYSIFLIVQVRCVVL